MLSILTKQEEINKLISSISAAPWVSVDTEANSMYAYPERICLLQISTPSVDAIIDTLSKDIDIQPLLKVLAKRPLIMHGADYDLRLLYRWYKFRPKELFDTMLAGKLLGESSCNLASLCEKYMGIHLIKKHQKADWGKRPIPQELLNYAIKDAFYLHELKTRIEKLLIKEGRLEWHRQNCQRLIKDCTSPIKPEPSREWRLGGCENFSRRELGILRALWYWREEEGIRANRPLYFIMKPDTMIRISKLAAAQKDFSRFQPHYSSERRERLIKAINEALELPTRKLPMLLRKIPQRQQRFSPTQQILLENITKIRDAKANEMKMDPVLIASRGDLVSCVRDSEHCHLNEWQKRLLGFEEKDGKLLFPVFKNIPLKKNSKKRHSHHKKKNSNQSFSQGCRDSA